MHLTGCTSGCGGAPPPAPLPSTCPPPQAPMPRPACPWGPMAPLPLPLGPLPVCPPARALGPAPCHPRPGPHCRRPCPSRARALAFGCARARPPSLAPLHAPGRPAHAPACPSRALAPSRLPAPCRAVCCPRSVPLRCCWPRCPVRVYALDPCRVCPGLLPGRAPGHFPCRLLSPAPRSRGWHAAVPVRRPLLPGSRVRRPPAFAAAAA